MYMANQDLDGDWFEGSVLIRALADTGAARTTARNMLCTLRDPVFRVI